MPYYPGEESLTYKSISLSGYSKDSTSSYNPLSTVYNTHNTYSHSQIKSTSDALKFAKRKLLISKSTFPQTGTKAGTWIGGNEI